MFESLEKKCFLSKICLKFLKICLIDSIKKMSKISLLELDVFELNRKNRLSN